MKKNWRYWWTLLYFVVYLVCFFFIEHFMPVTQYHMISTPIDHMIPFNEWFVFFYISWFGYIFFSFWYFFFFALKQFSIEDTSSSVALAKISVFVNAFKFTLSIFVSSLHHRLIQKHHKRHRYDR